MAGRMNLPKNILVPTDFSETAEAALDYAVALAGKLDAKVHLLHVVGIQLVGAEYRLSVTATMLDAITEGSQKELDRLAAARAGRVALGPTLLEIGDARTQITQTAAKIGADLIVMGTHGRRGIKRLLIGSVAESVVRTAPCPVLLVRQDVP
jgi:nucleotide-binding universal stress UspA family protein